MKTINHLKFDPLESFILYDAKLFQFQAFASWVRQFPCSIGLQAGEDLKTLKSYAEALHQIQTIAAAKKLDRHFIFVAIGGGSVTDFVGFLAATYQRGHPWIAVPSTWLCAVDSAHGGKNGLNLNGVKNQVGTIHFPKDVLICEQLLKLQPKERLLESAGEILKITLLSSAKAFNSFELDSDHVVKNLNSYIAMKNAIVKKDPFETKKIRYRLNFGHTVGHVFESEKLWPHGIAILFGMIFAIHFSVHKKILPKVEAKAILEKIRDSVFDLKLQQLLREAFIISEDDVIKKLSQDKKTTGKKVNFIFLKKRGQALVKPVLGSDILTAFHELKNKESFFDV